MRGCTAFYAVNAPTTARLEECGPSAFARLARRMQRRSQDGLLSRASWCRKAIVELRRMIRELEKGG